MEGHSGDQWVDRWVGRKVDSTVGRWGDQRGDRWVGRKVDPMEGHSGEVMAVATMEEW
jgi:hypothetical protein